MTRIRGLKIFRSLPPSILISDFWALTDPLPLFDALFQSHSPVHFPNLKSLNISISGRILPFSPKSLSYLLLTHNQTLQHLFLDFRDSLDDHEGEESLGAWLTDLVHHHDAHFPFLQSLDVYPSLSQAGLSAFLILLKRVSPTLSLLKIAIREITFEEAIQVVHALATEKLKTLHMHLTALSDPSSISLLTISRSSKNSLYVSTISSVQTRFASFLLHVNSFVISSSIHSTISSATGNTTLMSHVPKTYCTPGNFATF